LVGSKKAYSKEEITWVIQLASKKHFKVLKLLEELYKATQSSYITLEEFKEFLMYKV